MTSPRILVIEDEVLVGLDIVASLEQAGFREVGYAATEAEALQQIARGPWQAAVADANLNGVGIARVAHALRERGVPFVVVTGYARENLPDVLGDAPMVPKPFRPSVLVDAVQRLCGAAERA